jgi:DNA-directed RNA polymerase specialized sigma subunit
MLYRDLKKAKAMAWEKALKNQGLVKKYLIKNRWILDKSHTLEWDDYWHIGLMTLYTAACLCKAEARFSTYAYVCLKQNMRRAYIKQGYPTVYVPEALHAKINKDPEQMTHEETYTFNCIHSRVDLSCIDKFGVKQPEIEENSEMFVFFD